MTLVTFFVDHSGVMAPITLNIIHDSFIAIYAVVNFTSFNANGNQYYGMQGGQSCLSSWCHGIIWRIKIHCLILSHEHEYCTAAPPLSILLKGRVSNTFPVLC